MFFGGIREVEPIITRSDQVKTDDFVGCIKSLSVNGQQLNLKSSFINSSSIQSCPVPGGICANHRCGEGSCTEVNWRPVCQCPGGLFADDCSKSFQPVAIDTNATINFEISEKHKRKQLLAPGSRENEISLSFRTEGVEGRLFSAINTHDYTEVFIEKNMLVYETKKSGHPVINMSSGIEVTDGAWHSLVLKQAEQVLKVFLDDVQLGDNLESASTHDFLDPYLTKISFGGKKSLDKEGKHFHLSEYVVVTNII